MMTISISDYSSIKGNLPKNKEEFLTIYLEQRMSGY